MMGAKYKTKDIRVKLMFDYLSFVIYCYLLQIISSVMFSS
jgi:hypothetical protein